MIALLRSPHAGAARVLEGGRLGTALAGVAVATALAAIASTRLATDIRIQDVVFGPGRSSLVGVLIDALGVELTATLVYALERAFGYLVLATAFTPVFIWVLGASAVHVAARVRGSRAPFRPYLVLFGYATALSRIPADGTAALLGGAGAQGAQVAQAIGLAGLLWLGVVAWRGVILHYRATGDRALTILLQALLFFYLAPLLLIALAAVAIVIAASVLEIFTAP